MKKNIVILLLAIIIVLIIFGIIIIKKSKTINNQQNNHEYSYIDGEFNLNLIKTVNSKNQRNFLISPYSIEIALGMLKDGAEGDTKKEIENVIGNRKINDVTIKDRISIANAAFIKNNYREYVKEEYYQLLSTNYNSELIYDDFATPKAINDWVSAKTNGLITNILDRIDQDFVLGLANAIAIDVNWSVPFSCSNTTSEKFTTLNNQSMEVEMMHKTISSNAQYLKSDDATGIVLPYKNYDPKTGEEVFDGKNHLDFIAILPNKSITDYISNISNESLNNLLNSSAEASSKLEIDLALPRFKYDYELADFQSVLESLGIKLAFDSEQADFTNIMSNEIEELYVGEAIHKTHIDLNEVGTKAAAITYFGMFKSTAMPQEYKKINLKFNKPFIYIIRDNTTGEMLFFGTVYEPNKWSGSTCTEE